MSNFEHMYALFDEENPIRPLYNSRLTDNNPFKHQTTRSIITPPSTTSSDTNAENSKRKRKAKYYEEKKAMLYKTELCRAFEETGDCKFGQDCIFAHGQHELRESKKHPRYKTEICKSFYEQGTCDYGRRCCFLHIQSDGAQKSLIEKIGLNLEEDPNGDLLHSDKLDTGIENFWFRNR